MAAASRSFDEFNQAVANRLIDCCVQHGCNHFFVAPGSRSTPLAVAVANQPKATIIRHFDERGLSFACLGYGRGTGRPGAFVCTSGTAVANALPAVVEASLDHVPMLLLTADRPPELRDTGANQSINQVNLFGNYAAWFFDLPCPGPSLSDSFWDSTLRHAIAQTKNGPVHLNCMYREPFFATDTCGAPIPPSPSPLAMRNTIECEVPLGNTIVLVGNSLHHQEIAAAKRLASRLQCPCLFDITAGDRTFSPDLLLMRDNLPAPDVVIHVGGRFVSKRLLNFLSANPPKRWIRASRHTSRQDPLHRVTDVLIGDVAAICDGMRGLPTDNAFREAWQQAAAISRQAVVEALESIEQLNEPAIVYQLARLLPAGTNLFIGNSMPIRDFDTFAWWDLESAPRVAANRGASGIDGLLATAAGYATGTQQVTTCVVGDLSALHDLNSFALVAQSTIPIIVILINNDGGGIFHFLPVASQTQHFEAMFAMPHGRTFHHAAAMFGLDYVRPQSMQQFVESYQTAVQQNRSALIELSTDRRENLRVHRKIEAAVRGGA
jgi:2-succinyl-5-enolpyruvyl-6-hydroxy-3-cyclohexene-1-carboxylate synthase